MSGNRKDNYELDERAAIREFDGGLPRDMAESLAIQDMAEQPAEVEIEPQKAEPPKSRLEQLIAEREKVSKAMAAEKVGSDELKELSAKWQDLCSQIFEEKKGTTK